MKKCMATLLAGMMLSTATAFAAPSEHETIEQVALLQSLTLGHFDGSLTVKELKKLGDMGIGTFDGLNGEMVVQKLELGADLREDIRKAENDTQGMDRPE